MLFTDSPDPTTDDAIAREARYRQALRVGYLEMERIVEEIITPEFTRLGEILINNGYKAEVVVFDTESELEEQQDRLYICGAGLRVSRGYMNNAIVYTGDPHRFQFDLQTQNYASRTSEESVRYHKLTPRWFHQRVHDFAVTAFRGIDFSHILNHFNDDWEMFKPPFSLKMKNEYNYYNEIATAPSIERAFQISSYAAQKYELYDDQIIIVDANGRELT